MLSFNSLAALKPTTNSEASGYGLGFWRPYSDHDFNVSHFPHLDYGHFTYNDDNWNAVGGFTRFLPWNSVRVVVQEDVVRLDARILAYKFNPALARWRHSHDDVQNAWRSVRDADDAATRAAATELGIVVSNSQATGMFNATVAIGGSPFPSLQFDGYEYGPSSHGVPLGRATATADPGTGMLRLVVAVTPLSVQFWVQTL